MRLYQAYDPKARLPEIIIYTIRELRNALAHNDVIFDTRFKTSKIAKALCDSLIMDTKVTGIDFYSITDYLVLVIYLGKNLGFSRMELNRAISGFVNAAETLRIQIPFNLFSQIIHTDTRNKLFLLRSYLKR